MVRRSAAVLFLALVACGSAQRRGDPPGAASDARTAKVSASRQGLDALLSEVWADRARMLEQGAGVVYELYTRPQRPNALTMSEARYFQELADIALARARTAPARVQSDQKDLLQLEISTPDQLSPYARWAADATQRSALPEHDRKSLDELRRTFYVFGRAGPKETTRERVYVNARADVAPALMAFIVQSLLDDPARFPGVLSVKLAGPGAITTRTDNIVIYTSGSDATGRVVGALQRHLVAHPGQLAPDVPRRPRRSSDPDPALM